MSVLAKMRFGRLFKSWWPEARETIRYRRRRFMMHAPVGGLVGIFFGIFAAGRWESSLLWTPVFCGFLGLYTVHLTTRVESFLRTHTHSVAGRSAAAIAIGSDIFLGGFLGQALAFALGQDSAALFSGGAATLVAYNYFTTRLFWGDWIGDLVQAISGQSGTTREREYSVPRRLAAQGHVEEAALAYQKISEEKSGHTGPLILAAELFIEERRPADAIVWYRKALGAPRINARRASIFVEKIVELAAGDLNDPELARQDLLNLIEDFPTAEEVGWAATMLAMLPTKSGEDRWLGDGDEEE